jgi:hypothetical protein
MHRFRIIVHQPDARYRLQPTEVNLGIGMTLETLLNAKRDETLQLCA